MLVLPATVTLADAGDTQRMLAQALQQEARSSGPGDRVTVDASGLQQFDSSALAVLLDCRRLAAGWDKGFEVRHAPKKLVELARLYGLDTVLMPDEAATTAGV